MQGTSVKLSFKMDGCHGLVHVQLQRRSVGAAERRKVVSQVGAAPVVHLQEALFQTRSFFFFLHSSIFLEPLWNVHFSLCMACPCHLSLFLLVRCLCNAATTRLFTTFPTRRTDGGPDLDPLSMQVAALRELSNARKGYASVPVLLDITNNSSAASNCGVKPIQGGTIAASTSNRNSATTEIV
jgi:hypothetical protein